MANEISTLTDLNGVTHDIEDSTARSAIQTLDGQAVKSVNGQTPTAGAVLIGAGNIGYDNTNSGLTADDVQEAVDELNGTLSSQQEEIDAITTSTSVEDTEPYHIRSSARANVIGDTMSVEKIVGGTVAWNQLVDGGNFADLSKWQTSQCTLSLSDNIANIQKNSAVGATAYIRNYCGGVKTVIGHKYLSIFEAKLVSGYVEVFARVGAKSSAASALTSSWNTVSCILIATGEYAEWNVYASENTTATSEFSVRNAYCCDLTQMFGSTIADYIYSLEIATAGAGVAWFRKLFPNSYYAYNAGELMSVNTSAHVMKDANDNVIGNYPLDSSLTLRGIPKIANGKLYYDGDIYKPDGSVTRKYGIVDLGTLEWMLYGSGSTAFFYAVHTNKAGGMLVCAKYQATDISASNSNIGVMLGGNLIRIRDTSYTDAATFTTAMSGVYLVYELATPTTESATPYDKQQTFDLSGTEEYVDYAYTQETRDVSIPVGHETLFPTSLSSRIDAVENDLAEEQAKAEEVHTKLSGSIAQIEVSPATATHAVNTYLVWNSSLYKVISAIAVGESLSIGTNISPTTIMAELLALTA